MEEEVSKLFASSIGAQANNADLCMREFLKSLTERAYTWYVNLKAMIEELLEVPRLCSMKNYFKMKLNSFCLS